MFNMMIIRSILFNILFYSAIVVMAIVIIPLLIMPYHLTQKVASFWSWLMVGLLKRIVFVTHRVEGQRPDHQVIFASKHQAEWETIFLYSELNYPAPVLKRELIFIPIVGLFLMKIPSIPINRSTGISSLKKLVKHAKKIKATGDSIMIFPQGARVFSDAKKSYRPGVFAIYKATGLPVVPIALNSGLIFSKTTFVKKSGVIDVRLLEEIPPGLKREEFMTRLERAIENTMDMLPK